MKVLVTGAYGLVGAAFQRIALTNQPSHTYKFLSRKDCNLVDLSQVQETFDEFSPDVVVHLASRVGGVYDNLSDNYGFLSDNIKINMNIVECCKQFGVKKLINILSTCIFPDKEVTYPLSSDQLHKGLPHHSNIGYAYSKRVLHVASTLLPDVDVVNLVPTNLYGENDNYNIQAAHVIPALIHKTYMAMQNNSNLSVWGSGNAVRQFLYADDLAKVILHFVGNTFDESNITAIVSPPSSDEISIKRLVEMITHHFNFPKDKVVYDNSFDNGQLKKTTNNVELEKYIPGFQFTSLDIGLKQTIDYFIQNYDNNINNKIRK